MITADTITALELIHHAGNGRGLMPRAHDIINRAVPSLLRDGLITYAPNGYKLTRAGRSAKDGAK